MIRWAKGDWIPQQNEQRGPYRMRLWTATVLADQEQSRRFYDAMNHLNLDFYEEAKPETLLLVGCQMQPSEAKGKAIAEITLAEIDYHGVFGWKDFVDGRGNRIGRCDFHPTTDFENVFAGIASTTEKELPVND